MSNIDLGTIFTADGTAIRAILDNGIVSWRERREIPSVTMTLTYTEGKSARNIQSGFQLFVNPPADVIERGEYSIRHGGYTTRVAKNEHGLYERVPTTYSRKPDIRHRALDWSLDRFVEAMKMLMDHPEVKQAHRDIVVDSLPGIEEEARVAVNRVVALRDFLERSDGQARSFDPVGSAAVSSGAGAVRADGDGGDHSGAG